LRGLRIALWGLALAFGGATGTTPVWAQTAGEVSSDRDLQKAYDDAFAAMMADPQNLDKTFAFAELAARKGDLEGAISALERMLFINPDLPRVKLELGVLYYRLGSYETARAYLQGALEANPPPPVRERAESFLSEIDKRSLAHRLTGSVYVGFRGQSNANAAPGPGSTVTTVFGPSTLTAQSTKKGDFNLFGAANAKYIYDFEDQNQDTFEVTGSFYGARQWHLSAFNLTFFEITAGPRVPLPSAWLWDGGAVSLRAYAIYDYIDLHDDYYYRAPGAGFEVLTQARPGTLLQVNFEIRDKHFKNTALLQGASNQTGREMLVRGQLTQAITDELAMLLSGTYADVAAKGDSFAPADQAYHYYDYTLGLSYSFDAPFMLTEQPWNVTATATRAFYIYRQPDPTIDPFDTRFDRDWRFAFVGSIPLADDWTMIGTLGRTIRKSILDNYEFNNNYVSLGVSWRF
jgi:tetratricopeptide (TPR) repeat protein